jgi:hypothetical protein
MMSRYEYNPFSSVVVIFTAICLAQIEQAEFMPFGIIGFCPGRFLAVIVKSSNHA